MEWKGSDEKGALSDEGSPMQGRGGRLEREAAAGRRKFRACLAGRCYYGLQAEAADCGSAREQLHSERRQDLTAQANSFHLFIPTKRAHSRRRRNAKKKRRTGVCAVATEHVSIT